MKFSCMIWPYSGTDIDPVVRLAQAAESCGFETVYIGDSQMIWNDVWVALTACALNTERVRLGTGVTNLVTRHPTATANAINSLNMISQGRAVLGVGAGDSAVRTAGLSPATLAETNRAIPPSPSGRPMRTSSRPSLEAIRTPLYCFWPWMARS